MRGLTLKNNQTVSDRVTDWKSFNIPSSHAWRTAAPHRRRWRHPARGRQSTRRRAHSLSQHRRRSDFLSIDLTYKQPSQEVILKIKHCCGRSSISVSLHDAWWTLLYLRPYTWGPSGPPRGSQTPHKRSTWTSVGGVCPLAFPPIWFFHMWKISPEYVPASENRDTVCQWDRYCYVGFMNLTAHLR